MAQEIKNIAVIGSGIMGRGISHAAMQGGFTVTLHDVSRELLEKAQGYITETLKNGVELGKVTPENMISALQRLTCLTDLAEAVKESDLVIEAIPEDVALKLNLFRDLAGMAPPRAILATNTSSLSVTEIAAVTGRAKLVAGMHFFNPVQKMKLVEIIRGLQTGEETIRAIEQIAHLMGKETVIVNDFPGFATSRLNVLLGNEAFYMMMEGVASAEDIDKAAKLGLNLPMGPLELGDLVGLDTRLHVLEYLHRSLGERFRPCPLMVKYVKAGHLGRKTGEGVYNYEDIR